ncbi:hypothetical protein GALMADRAFT_254149 [Galerina marginata CBS 339.88]|uniref:Ricin B lectin domain-containing protein n=1 Tax=Galerina marginata (strain CBS 339.88) TaxID=685588 RepID=A0A067SX81_GALM3|nr:hypothetical protein GALMADRAFT_254149 [Galerina marginata CBS 339.88]
MAPLIVPSPDVRYRIHNVDFGTYLERRSLVDVRVRRFKESSQQQWFFNKISDGIFEIVNAADKEYFLEASSIGSAFIPTLHKKLPATRPGLKWKLVDSGRGSFYILNTDNGNYNIFLHLEDKDSIPKLTQDSSLTSTSTTISKESSHRWNIVEDLPAALPDGTGMYVIQTSKGEALQSVSPAASTPKVYLGGSNLGDEHIWEIVDLGNGKGTIRNIHADAFIDVQQVGSAGGEWTQVLSQTTPAAQWNIRKIGAFAFSLTIERPINTTMQTRFALTAMNDVIVLKPNKEVQNQTWSIVPRDLASFNPLIIANPAVNLPAGTYALRSDNGYYLRVDNSHVYGDANQLSYVKVELAGGSGATGLGHVYISDDPGYTQGQGFFYAAEFGGPGLTYHLPYIRSSGIKELWRIEMVYTAPARYVITHVRTAKSLESLNSTHSSSTLFMGKPRENMTLFLEITRGISFPNHKVNGVVVVHIKL